MKEDKKYFNLSKNLLKQAKDKLSKKNLDPTSVANYAFKFSRSTCLEAVCLMPFTQFIDLVLYLLNVIGPLAHPSYFC